MQFFLALAGPLLAAGGVTELADSPALKRFVSYVPFVTLVLLTPGLGWRRRLGGLALGCLLLFLGHAGLVIAEHRAHRGAGDAFGAFFPAAIFADALPFVLWALIARDFLRQLLAQGMLRRAD